MNNEITSREEALELLRGGEYGVKEWNRRRRRFLHLDLSEADLSGADLQNADLSTILLDKAVFRNAKLVGASFSASEVQHADFRDAVLNGVSFSETSLDESDLRGAQLPYVNFLWTGLSGTRFEGAFFSNTSIASSIGGSIGLDETLHGGPSDVSARALSSLRGELPIKFLRGCGLSDWQIEAARLYGQTLSKGQRTDIAYRILELLGGRPIEFYSVFISYSQADRDFTRQLHDALQEKGVRCWLDEKQLLPGNNIYDQVDRGIKHWDKLLLCASRHSLTSWWVDNEIDLAFEKECRLSSERKKRIRVLVPLNLDKFMFSPDWQNGKAGQLRSRLAADFTTWQEGQELPSKSLDAILKALQTNDTGREPVPVSKL